MHIPLALKLVSVPFAAFGLALPTFNLGFYERISLCFVVFEISYGYLKVLLLVLLFLGARRHRDPSAAVQICISISIYCMIEQEHEC